MFILKKILVLMVIMVQGSLNLEKKVYSFLVFLFLI